MSRYLLCCEAVAQPDGAPVRLLFEAAFCEFGLRLAIRSDNGPPFASIGAHGYAPKFRLERPQPAQERQLLLAKPRDFCERFAARQKRQKAQERDFLETARCYFKRVNWTERFRR
jgi:hypothetical protein